MQPARPRAAIPCSRVTCGRSTGFAASWHRIEPTDLVRETAKRLLRSHDLRAGHSLQLAAAIAAAENRPPTLGFVCRDERLSLAAQREGFEVR
jgi:hypothetical protein